MKLIRQNKLPVDCVPEDVSVYTQDFWVMRRIADDIRWNFGNVVVSVGIFDDFMRAYWYRVSMEPYPLPPETLLARNTEHRDYPKSLQRTPMFFADGRSKKLGERCQWPRYKTIDVPVSYFDYEMNRAESVVQSYDLEKLMKDGGLTC